MTEQSLLPCPFCGEAPMEDRIEPHEHDTAIVGLIPLPYSYPGSWSVECVHCECRIFSHESRELAVTRWNTRARTAEHLAYYQQAEKIRDRLEAEVEQLRAALTHPAQPEKPVCATCKGTGGIRLSVDSPMGPAEYDVCPDCSNDAAPASAPSARGDV